MRINNSRKKEIQNVRTFYKSFCTQRRMKFLVQLFAICLEKLLQQKLLKILYIPAFEENKNFARNLE